MINLTVNGVAYPYPQAGDLNWATGASAWASAVTSSMLSLSGGSFPLTAQVDFGPSFGIKALSLLTESANPSGTGVIKLSNADGIGWRNFANTADLLLSVNSSNQLLFNGAGLGAVSGTGNTTTIGLVLTTGTLTANINALSITDSLVSSTAAISYSKLNLTGNIVNADVSASAAIAYSKLNLAGAVLNADLAGSIALSKLLPLTGYVSGAGTVAATDTVLGAFQKLNGNDTLAVQRAIVTTKGDILAASASSTVVRFPAGADGQVVVADSSQSLGLRYATLQQGLKNYVTNSNFENGSTSPWSTFNATMTGVVPTGAPFGSSTSIAGISVTATNPLAGTTSLQISTNAAWAVGDGLTSGALPIDREDRSKVLSFKANFEVVSGAANLNVTGTSANSLHVYIWDTQSSTWIQPTGVYSMNAYTGQISGTFQTSAACTSVQLVIICANATAGAVSINFDDFSLGPQSQAIGVPVSDWTSYTPVFTNFGTVTSVNVQSRRVGDTLFVRGSFAAGVTASTLAMSLGYAGVNGNVAIDFNKVANNARLGGGSTNNTASTTWFGSLSVLSDNTSPGLVRFGARTSAIVETTYLTGSNLANSAIITFEFDVPITGWSSNTVMSSDTDTRVIAASATTLANATVANATTTQFPLSTVTDDAAGNISGNTFVVSVPGRYRWSLTGGSDASVNTGLVYLSGRKNSAAIGTPGVAQSSTAGPTYPTVIVESVCKAGDVLDFSILYNQTSARNVSGTAIFERLSGPSVIAASESVNARYTSAAGASIPNGGTPTVVDFASKDFDSHNAVTTGAGVWKFTAPMPGKYRISTNLRYGNGLNWGLGSYVGAIVHKNASAYFSNDTAIQVASTGLATGPTTMLSGTVSMLAGEYIDVRTQHGESTARALVAASTLVWVSIERVGN